MGQIRERVGGGPLLSVGLSETERAAYEALVELGSATARDLRDANVARSDRLAEVLRGLEAKGLVSRKSGRPVRYEPVPPEVGLELLLVQREEELRSARLAALDLTDRFHQARARRDVSGLIEIVSGERAVAERYGAVHRTAREEIRVMSRPPYVMTAKDTSAISEEAHRKNIRVRNIVDPRNLDLDEQGTYLAATREDIAHGEEYRVMPNVPLKLVVADDRAALLPLEIHPGGIQSAVLFHASALLEALIDVFETCWRLAYPLDILGEGDQDLGPSAEAATASERELLGLLSAGIPDAAIARQLGLSHTTVQRRILALKTRLGATTRFQAGLQAALRGWITDAAEAPEDSVVGPA